MEIEVSKIISKTFVYTTKEERDEAVEMFKGKGYNIKDMGYQSYDAKRLQNIKELKPGQIYPYLIIEFEEQ